MLTSGAPAAAPGPRRARYLIPRELPRRADLIAGLVTAALLAHLLFAQVTLALAVALYLTGRVSRWRWTWLAVPAGAGLTWSLAIGPGAALSGLVAGPGQVAAYLAAVPGQPGRLLHLGAAFAGAGHWLPRQLPLALILGAAEAAAAAGLAWLHTDAAMLRPPRTGLVVAVRRRYTRRAIGAGQILTRDGSRLGVTADGRGAAVSWAEAEGGVLAAGHEPGPPGPAETASAAAWRAASASRAAGASRAGPDVAGPPGPGPAATGFRLVHAAIRRRKPVIVVDLSGQRGWLAGALAAVCAAAGAPLHEFGPAGPGYYDPLRTGDPARAAALLAGLLDWAGTTAAFRRGCAAYLAELFAVRAAAPPRTGQSVLLDAAALLDPAALAERLREVPAGHQNRAALAARLATAGALVQGDPDALAAVAGQLTRLAATPAGRWLGRGREQLSLARVLRERAVGLFALDPAEHGPAAAMIGRVVAADALALCADLRAIGVSGDAVAWFSGCEQLPAAALAELVAAGYRAGVTVVLSTTSAGAAASLAGAVNVLALHPVGDQDAAAELAGLASGQPGTGPLAAFSTAAAGLAGPAPGRESAPGRGPDGPGPGRSRATRDGTGGTAGPWRPAEAGVPAEADGAADTGGAAEADCAAAEWRTGSRGLPPAPEPRPVPGWALRVPEPAPDASWAAGGPAPPGGPSGAAGPAPAAPLRIKGGTDVTPAALLGPHPDELALVVKGPRRRVAVGCRAVPARLPARAAGPR